MSSIDSRIVTMKFDNASFKSGATSALDILGKLKTAVTGLPSNAAKSLGSVSSAAQKVNMSGISGQVSGVANSFTALQTVATVALGTITAKAVSAGLNIAKSLTFSPVMGGFQEYELKMGSIQTILANTSRYGTKLADVNKALNQLNHYADKTIYNFGDMTKNIGLFTNAGIRLEDATSMIQGFSNAAAASGTNAQGAASAAYQLSQALSAGTIRLMDWRSLQNVGMGNKNMQRGLIDIADATGQLDKAMVSHDLVSENFNGSLEKNWLSADTMSTYLKIMAGDMSAAEMASLGLSKQQIKTFQGEQKMAQDAATKVRTFTQLMSTIKESIGSTWSGVFSILIGDFNQATNLFTNINNVIGGFFNKTGNALTHLLKGWAKLGGRDLLIKALSDAFKALYKILKPIGRAFRAVFPPETAQGLYDLTEKFANFTEGLKISAGTMHDIRKIFKAIFAVFRVGLSIVGGIIKYFATLIGLLTHGTGGLLHFVASIAQVISHMAQWINKTHLIGNLFDHVIAGRAKILTPIIEALGKILYVMGDLIHSGAAAFFKALGDAVNKVKPYLPEIQAGFENIGTAIKTYVIDQISKLLPVLKSMGDAISNAFSSLSGISIGGGLSGLGSLFDLGDGPKKAADGIGKVKDAVSSLGGSAAGGAKSGLSSFIDGLLEFLSMIAKVGGAILLGIAWLGKAIASEFAGLFKGGSEYGGQIGDFISNIVKSIGHFFSGISYGDIILAVYTGISTALGAGFARVVWNMGGLLKAFSGVASSINGVLSSAASGLEDVGKAAKSEAKAKVIMSYAVALGVLAAALFVLSKIPLKQLASALGAVAALMLILTKSITAITKSMPDKGAISAAARLGGLAAMIVALGAAMLLMAVAMKIMASIKVGDIVKGLSTMAIAIGGVILAINAINKSGGAGGILKAAIAMGILGASMIMLAAALKVYAMMDANTIFEGLLGIGTVLGGIGLAMRAFPTTGMMAAAAGMVLIAGAVLILSVALKKIAALSGGNSWQAIITLGAALLILVVAANALTGALPGAAALFVIAAALAVFVPQLIKLGDMSWGSILKGLIALSAAMLVLAVAGAALLYSGASVGLIMLGAAIALIGGGLMMAGIGIMFFATALQVLAASGAAAAAVVTSVINDFLKSSAEMAANFREASVAWANAIRQSAPAWIRAGTAILVAFLHSVIRTAPLIGKAMRTVIGEGLKTIRAMIPDFVATGFAALMGFLNGLNKNMNQIAAQGVQIVLEFLRGVDRKRDAIVATGVKVIVHLAQAIGKEIGHQATVLAADMGGMGAEMVHGLLQGIMNLWHNVTDWLADQIHKIPGPLRKIMGIASPSKVMMELGGYISEGLAVGIKQKTPMVEKQAEDLGRTSKDVLTMALRGATDALQLDPNFNPVIAPVLDLTQLSKDANGISALMATSPISADVSYSAASALAAEQQANADAAAEAASSGDISFTQNITSPEPIDPTKVYRATRNQLSMVKEALKKK